MLVYIKIQYQIIGFITNIIINILYIMENITYNTITKLFDVPNVDYQMDKKYLKNWEINFYKKEDIPYGLLGFAIFKIKNYVYIFGGFSAGENSINGLSFYKNKLTGKHESKFYNKLLKYDLEKDIWKDLGEIDIIYPRSSMLYCTYKNKMYIFGGLSFEFMSLNYLKSYKAKYGKWPEKKGMNYFNDCFEISVSDDDKIFVKKILNLPFNYVLVPVSNNSIIYNDKLYFIGGLTDKFQNNSLPNKFKLMIKNKYGLDINNSNCNSLLFYINLKKIEDGVMVQSKFPGIPVAYCNLIIKEDLLYLFSSTHYCNSKKTNFRPNEKNKVSCRDNWTYNFETNKWNQIESLPMKGVIGRKAFQFNDRYIFFFGSSKAFYSITYKENIEILTYPIKEDFSPKFKYGMISNQYSKYNEKNCKNVTTANKIKAYDYYQHYFSDFILIYDIIDEQYFTLNKKMPLNINILSIVKHKGELFFFGGECNDILINEKFHGIQSNLCFSAKINIIDNI